ncbi:MAG: hypothetical protein R3F34_18520 [Planctomycetota bacterium]
MRIAPHLLALALVAAAAGLVALGRDLERPRTERRIFEAIVVGSGPGCGEFTGLPHFERGYLVPGLYDGRRPIAQPTYVEMVSAPFGWSALGADGTIEGGAVHDAAELARSFERLGDRLGTGSILAVYRLLGPLEPDAWAAWSERPRGARRAVAPERVTGRVVGRAVAARRRRLASGGGDDAAR